MYVCVWGGGGLALCVYEREREGESVRACVRVLWKH